MPVLAAAAALADKFPLGLGHLFGDGFPIGHLGLAHPGIHLELPHQAVDDDLQVEFPHAGDDGLAGVGVAVDPERRVFRGDLGQRLSQFVLVRLGGGLDGDIDDRLRNMQGLQHHGVPLIRQGVAGGGVLEPHQGHDVPGIGLADLFPLVGVHLEEPADALLDALGGVQHRWTRRPSPRNKSGERSDAR